jgi:formate dehydrogenase major subunit/formate dehydrogenase alpha subunit
MMKAMQRGEIRGMYLMGEDIVISEPNVCKVEAAMNELEFVVVQDIFFNESCRFADVVLPAACFAEKDGVFTNSDRRVQRVRKAVEPPGTARADWEILLDVMRRAGMTQPEYAGPGEIYAELASLAPKFAGISHDRIDREGGLQWPVASTDAPSTEYLHKGGVLRGKGLFMPVEYRAPFSSRSSSPPDALSTTTTRRRRRAAPRGYRRSNPRHSSRSIRAPRASSGSTTASSSTSSRAVDGCAAGRCTRVRSSATRSGCRSTSPRRGRTS